MKLRRAARRVEAWLLGIIILANLLLSLVGLFGR